MQDEYLDQGDTALKTISQAIAESGCEAPILVYQRATVLFRQKKYADAFQAWNSVLEPWSLKELEDTVQSTSRPFQLRNCRRTHGRLGDRGNSLRQRKEIGPIDQKPHCYNPIRSRPGICAVAKRREGRRDSGIRCLPPRTRIGVATECPARASHECAKVAEHVIKWCAIDSGMLRPEAIPPPPPGLCSEAKPAERHDSLKGVVKLHLKRSGSCSPKRKHASGRVELHTARRADGRKKAECPLPRSCSRS